MADFNYAYSEAPFIQNPDYYLLYPISDGYQQARTNVNNYQFVETQFHYITDREQQFHMGSQGFHDNNPRNWDDQNPNEEYCRPSAQRYWPSNDGFHDRLPHRLPSNDRYHDRLPHRFPEAQVNRMQNRYSQRLLDGLPNQVPERLPRKFRDRRPHHLRHESHRKVREPDPPFMHNSAPDAGNIVLRDRPVTRSSLVQFLNDIDPSKCHDISENELSSAGQLPVLNGVQRRCENGTDSNGNNDYSNHEDLRRSEAVTSDYGFSGPEVKKPKLESASFRQCPELWFGDAEPSPPLKLYHYTNQAGAMGIMGDRFIGVNVTEQPKLGTGIYFTEMPPESSTEDIMFNNYRTRDEASNKISRTEYCFEFLSTDIPNLKFCKDPLYQFVKGRKRRNVWVASLHRLYLGGSQGTYYIRELDGMGEPKRIHTRKWNL